MSQASVRSVSAGNETSVTWGTHAEDDLILLIVKYGAGTVATPAGFTAFPGSPFLHTTEGIAVFYQFAASAAEGPTALTGGTDHMWGKIVAIGNAHLTKPFHNKTGFRQLGSQTTAVGPGLQTTYDDILMLDVFGLIADNAGPVSTGGEVNADLTSFTKHSDSGTITGGGGSLVICSGVVAAPSGFVAGTTLTTIVSSAWSGFRVAINPIADRSIGPGDVEIAGAPAANGGNVRVLDLTQPEASGLCVFSTTGGGTGTFTLLAPYTDHSYQVCFENGVSFGASALGNAV